MATWPHGATAFVLAMGLSLANAPPTRAQNPLTLNPPGSAPESGTSTTQPLKIRIVSDEPDVKRPEASPVLSPIPELPPPLPPPPIPKAPDGLDETVIRINTASPTSADLFRLETEQQFRQRLVNETERWRDRIHIPDLSLAPTQPLPAQRGWPSLLETVEPGTLCFFRLGFAQPRSERYGQTLGALQPFVSAGIFYGGIATWPIRIVAPPWTCGTCDDLSDLTCYPRKTWPPAFMHE